jgi:hypothetical protein
MKLISHSKPPKELGAPVRGNDRAGLAVLCSRYTEEAMRRAIEDIYALRKIAPKLKVMK